MSVLASGSPGTGWLAAKGQFVVLALYVTLHVLDTTDRAERFVAALTVLAGVAALAGLVQVLACPGVPPGEWPLSRFFSRCDRARGPFSIYMTSGASSRPSCWPDSRACSRAERGPGGWPGHGS